MHSWKNIYFKARFLLTVVLYALYPLLISKIYSSVMTDACITILILLKHN